MSMSTYSWMGKGTVSGKSNWRLIHGIPVAEHIKDKLDPRGNSQLFEDPVMGDHSAGQFAGIGRHGRWLCGHVPTRLVAQKLNLSKKAVPAPRYGFVGPRARFRR